eukprot:Awhi_evm1s10248
MFQFISTIALRQRSPSFGTVSNESESKKLPQEMETVQEIGNDQTFYLNFHNEENHVEELKLALEEIDFSREEGMSQLNQNKKLRESMTKLRDVFVKINRKNTMVSKKLPTFEEDDESDIDEEKKTDIEEGEGRVGEDEETLLIEEQPECVKPRRNAKQTRSIDEQGTMPGLNNRQLNTEQIFSFLESTNVESVIKNLVVHNKFDISESMIGTTFGQEIEDSDAEPTTLKKEGNQNESSKEGASVSQSFIFARRFGHSRNRSTPTVELSDERESSNPFSLYNSHSRRTSTSSTASTVSTASTASNLSTQSLPNALSKTTKTFKGNSNKGGVFFMMRSK